MSAAAPRSDGRTARRGHTRRRILQAAVELFAERGIGSTTMDDVAAAAGVSKGTIFYNFVSKNDLCAQVITAGAQVMADQLEAARAHARGWAALESLTLTAMRQMDQAPAMAQVVSSELFRINRPWSASLRPARDVLLAPVVAVLREVAGERRRVDPELPLPHPAGTDAVAATLLGGLVAATLNRLAFGGPPLEQVHAALLGAIGGLRAD